MTNLQSRIFQSFFFQLQRQLKPVSAPLRVAVLLLVQFRKTIGYKMEIVPAVINADPVQRSHFIRLVARIAAEMRRNLLMRITLFKARGNRIPAGRFFINNLFRLALQHMPRMYLADHALCDLDCRLSRIFFPGADLFHTADLRHRDICNSYCKALPTNTVYIIETVSAVHRTAHHMAPHHYAAVF